MSEPNLITNDAIVTYADAERWVKELYMISTAELRARLLELEPAIAAVALQSADRLYQRLRRAGASEPAASGVAAHVARTGFLCAELTRRGFRKFNDDTIEEGGAA